MDEIPSMEVALTKADAPSTDVERRIAEIIDGRSCDDMVRQTGWNLGLCDFDTEKRRGQDYELW